MFIYILLVVLCAKLKGYRIMPIMKVYSLYPFAVTEVLYVFLQVNIFTGNYSYVQYSSIFKNIFLYSLILPILVYKLYKTGIYGSLLIITGTILNKFVISQNGGKMPVYATLSKITGYYKESAILTADNIHMIGNETTKYKFLTDYIDIGCSILSIGDILIHSFAFLVIYSVIIEVNKGIENTRDNRKGYFIWRRSK